MKAGFPLTAGNFITLTGTRGSIFTFTLEEGAGVLQIVSNDDNTFLWDFETHKPYRLIVDVKPSAFVTIPDDETHRGS